MFEASLCVGSGETGISALNKVALGEALESGEEYGRYMILYCEDRVLVEEATVSDMNTDPRGRMFAERTVTVENGEFTLLSVALSPDGETAYARTDIDGGFLKRAGVPMTVAYNITLDVTHDGATFTAGNNKLVEWLLTGGRLGVAGITLGENRSPVLKYALASETVGASVKAAVRLTASAVEFSAVCPTAYEAFLCLDGTPVARFLPHASAAKTVTLGGRASISGTVVQNAAEIIEINNVYCNGSETDCSVERGRTRADGIVKAPFRLGKNTVLHTDGDGSLAVAAGDGEATFLRVANGGVEVCGGCGINCDGENVRITSDACLFCMEEGVLVKIDRDGNRRKIGDFTADDFDVAVNGEDDYLIAVKNGEFVEVYRHNGEILSLTEKTDAGSGCALTKLDCRRIAVFGEKIGGKVYGMGFDSSDVQRALDDIRDGYDSSSAAMSGRLIVYTSADGTSKYVTDYEAYDGQKLPSSDARLFDEVCLSDSRAYFVTLSGGVVYVDLSGLPEVSGMCRLSSFLVAVGKDGTPYFVPLGGRGVMLKSDKFYPGITVSYTCKIPALTDNGKFRLTLGMDFGR